MYARCRMPLHNSIEGDCVWTGDAIADHNRWRYDLDADSLAEVENALAGFRKSGMAWRDMTVADFTLPGLAALLEDVAEELENGSGLARIGGLPVEKYTDDDLRALWYGLGLNLGRPVYQDCQGLLMREIQDKREDTDARMGHQLTAKDGRSFTSSKARTLSSGPLRFHTDRCDVVGLLCVRQAAAGGISQVASAPAVHNAILDRHPDLLELLYQPLHRSRLGEEHGGETETYVLPVFGVRDGRFTSHYSRTYVEAAQEVTGVPAMTPEHWRALDVLHDTATELCFEMRLQPGDMQFLNNHVVYHARTAFEDTGGEDSGGKSGRLLLRLWLAMANSRALPDDHAVLWRDVSAGALRGGISQP